MDDFLRVYQNLLPDASYNEFDRIWEVGMTTDNVPKVSRKYILRDIKEQSCAICRKQILSKYDLINCPRCDSPFHDRHFAEAIKMKGECPICKARIFVVLDS